MARKKVIIELREVESEVGNLYYNLPVPKKNLRKYLVKHAIVIDGNVYTSKAILEMAIDSVFSTNASGFIWKKSL